MPLPLDVERACRRHPSQAPDTLPPLFSWWTSTNVTRLPASRRDVGDESHEVADLLQRAGLVHAGAA